MSDVNFGNAVYMIDRCTLQNQLDGSAYTLYEMWILYNALNRHGWKTIVIQYSNFCLAVASQNADAYVASYLT